MEKVLIVGCKKAMDDVCIAFLQEYVGFNRRDGEFSRYKDKNAELIGILRKKSRQRPIRAIFVKLTSYHINQTV